MKWSSRTKGLIPATNRSVSPICRRALLLGLVAAAVTLPTVMPAIAAPYSTYFGTISVKDPTYGAKGDGVTDDTVAIQAALNAAFGSSGSPHGQGNPFINFEVYFPPGNYVVTAPLNLVGILGGRIRGAGNGTSQILFHATGAEGNVISSEITNATPLFVLDGVAYTIFEGLSISANAPTTVALTTNGATAAGNNILHFPSTTGIVLNQSVFNKTAPGVISAYVTAVTPTTVTVSANATGAGVGSGDSMLFLASTVGVYVYQSGSHGYTGGLFFQNMNIGSFGTGILAGSAPGNCDDSQLINVQFNNCALSGLRTISFNALNWGVFGGGASGCGTANTYLPPTNSGNGAAGYSCITGSITTIQNVGVTGNFPDFYNGTSQGMAIIGSRSESLQCAIAAGSTITFVGCSFGGGDATKNPSINLLDGTFSGTFVLSGCNYNPNNASTYTHPANFAILGNNGVLIADGLTLNDAGKTSVTGASNAKVYLRATLPVPPATVAALLTGFTGTVAQNI